MSTEPNVPIRTALLLIAHGSRRVQANADLDHLAEQMRQRRLFALVATAYLELVEPTIAEAGAACVRAGANRVVLLPYFLSPGVHAIDDMKAASAALAKRFPSVDFRVAEPLGRHPLLTEVVAQRAAAVLGESTARDG